MKMKNSKWIVVIVIVCIVLAFSYSFYSKTINEKQYTRDNFEELVTEDLEDKGYEVLYATGQDDTFIGASVRMKSLGDRESQINDAIFALSYYSSIAEYDVKMYMITILEPTQTCVYTTMRSDPNSINAYMYMLINDYEHITDDQVKAHLAAINDMIKSGTCS